MVVCKFFLQGTCKFGNSCRFEHQLDNSGGSSILKQNNNQNVARSTTMDSNTLIQFVINDMLAAEHGKQWIFSSYSPFKDKPTFPGFEDKSFEEIRFGFYEAKKSGNLEHYKQTVQMWYQEAFGRMKTLQNPNQEIVKLLTQIYSSNQPFQNNQGNTNNNNGFGSNNSIFGGNTQQNQNNNVFGQNTIFQNANNSPFSQNQSPFGNNTNNQAKTFNQNPTNIFNQNPIFNTNNSIFNNTQFQPTNNPFNQQNQFANQQNQFANQQNQFANQSSQFPNQFAPQTTPFIPPTTQATPFLSQPNQNVFSPTQNQTSIFQNAVQNNAVFNNPAPNYYQNPQSVFNQNSIFGNSIMNKNPGGEGVKPSVVDNNSYSKIEDLTQDEIKSFECDEFDFGKIPERPPTLEMCF